MPVTPAVQHCSTAAALLELRGKQAAATAAVEAAAAAAVAVVASQTGMIPSPEMLDVGNVPDLSSGVLDDKFDDATSAAAQKARQLHAEFETVRRSVMQHGADTYRGGIMFLSRLL